MKTTIKFDLQPQQNGFSKAIVKIIQPDSAIENNLLSDPSTIDSRDNIARQFLESGFGKSTMFMVDEYFSVPRENPTHHITVISPITEREYIHIFRGKLLSIFIPEDCMDDVLNTLAHEVLSGPNETSETKNICKHEKYMDYLSVAKNINLFFDGLETIEFTHGYDNVFFHKEN